MLAPGWGTGTRGGSPPGVKLCSLPVLGQILNASIPYILGRKELIDCEQKYLFCT